MAPDVETVPARCPAAATTVFSAAPAGKLRNAWAAAGAIASCRINDAAHSTPAAVIGTVRLSSSLMGIVSGRAAPPAAANGAASENHNPGAGVPAGRHHQARSAPAT